MPWRPLSRRGSPEAEAEYDALVEGIPAWMTVACARWLRGIFLEALPFETAPAEALHMVEQMLRRPLNWRDDVTSALNSLIVMLQDDDAGLDVLDACLRIADVARAYNRIADLALTLETGGSAWMVGTDEQGRSCLVRRVDETAQRAADAEMGETGNAARHLRTAWHKVYGRTTDASGSYREAVRAVEAAAKATVTPDDRVATLGKMIGALKDKPDKWQFDLGDVGGIRSLMEQLWTAQLDRHGTDDESVALSVTPEQAEAAVHVAVTLVHLFRNGHVRRVVA